MLARLRGAVLATGAGPARLGRAPGGAPRARRRSPTRRATNASGSCSATRSPHRWAACTSTSACPTPKRRSARSTACAGTCRCCRRWLRTPPSATAATRGSPPRARSPCAAGRARVCRGRCATSRTSSSSRAGWRAPRRSPTTPGSGGSCARTRASARSRCARSTCRRRSRTPRRWRRSRTASRAARRRTSREPDPPAEVLEEGIFRAARFGVQARLPDAEGHLHPVAELLEQALELARDPAAELGLRARARDAASAARARRRRRTPARRLRDRGDGLPAARDDAHHRRRRGRLKAERARRFSGSRPAAPGTAA